MKKPALLSRMTAWWRRLHLVDRLLLIFMVILLAQSARSLFFYECASQNSGAMDTAIRTTAASIFGYFISAGFRGAKREGASTQAGSDLAAGQNRTTNLNTRTGLSENEGMSSEARSKTTVNQLGESTDQRLRQQMLIVGMIGISSLLILVIACDSTQDTTSAAAALSQLHDFVSGSVGFLIGHAGAVRRGA
ncbi:MAG: hypothetical protein IJX37_08120 [Oscillospiraceae bacterium]|nr:hypothetical protein [Oscillospiraceae bacterium]